ncbi:MAG: hypothetical protein SO533_04180 [Eubacteriales bacterium]|nr:hypothetical protein [Eubacteriales bacterium]
MLVIGWIATAPTTFPHRDTSRHAVINGGTSTEPARILTSSAMDG